MAVLELTDAQQRTVAPVTQIVQPQPLRSWSARTYKGATAETLSGVLTKADRGDLEDWAEFADHMLQLDPHLRAKYEERALHIVGSEIEVGPGIAQPGQEALAQDAADFFRLELEQARDLESTLMGLLHAEGIGWAGAEHDWQRTRGEWHSNPTVIDARDIGFESDWRTKVRTYKSDKGRQISAGEWLKVEDLEDGRFIFHVPRKVAGRVNVAGDLRPIAWYFVFKKWALVYMQEGLEKHGNPLVAGFVPENAPQAVADEFHEALTKFTQSQTALFRVDPTVVAEDRLKFFQPNGTAGEAWREALNFYNREITKGLLGSDLNTEVGSTGGNRSLGESQFDATILPRLMSMAKRLAGTLERYWAKPLLRFNAHVFGGQVPPTPQIRFKLVADERPEIPAEAIGAGLRVTQDEYGAAFGLEPGGVRGEAVVTPVAKTAPQAAQGGAAPDVPFPQSRRPAQLSLPWTKRRTSATSSASTTRVGSVPYDGSGGS